MGLNAVSDTIKEASDKADLIEENATEPTYMCAGCGETYDTLEDAEECDKSHVETTQESEQEKICPNCNAIINKDDDICPICEGVEEELESNTEKENEFDLFSE
jgi:rubrerythrin